MDQHEHVGDSHSPPIPRKTTSLPSLNVHQSLRKIIEKRRRGFCFEPNFSFAWLLQSLRYVARLALADVYFHQETPAHVVILVDFPNESLLVDPGFGEPGICEIPLSISHYDAVTDPHGNVFRLEAVRHDCFDTALYRTRIHTGAEEAMYQFHSQDDMEMNAEEFRKGLDMVLTTSELFTTKRICVLSTCRGHVTLGSNYVKWVEQGNNVRQEELDTETEWRRALKEYFGVELVAEED